MSTAVVTNLQDRRAVVTNKEQRKTVVYAKPGMGARGPAGPMALTMSIKGDLIVGPGSIPFPIPFDKEITYILFAVGTAPVGTPIIIDVLRNGVSLFTVSPKPTILVGQTVSQIVLPDITFLPAGSKTTVDILQIGSILPGSNATILIGVA